MDTKFEAWCDKVLHILQTIHSVSPYIDIANARTAFGKKLSPKKYAQMVFDYYDEGIDVTISYKLMSM